MTAAAPPGPARLTIDLGAIAGNYRRLCRTAGASEVAGVVKADGYGLGAVPVARALARAGCRTFFVARAGEGMALRPAVPGARIFVLDGVVEGTAQALAAHSLVPVLNGLDDHARWAEEGARRGQALPAALHLDTGMCRLGFSARELDRLWARGMDGVRPVLVMSHLACAEEPDHPLNQVQLERFRTLAEGFPGLARSLANSSGLYLGAAWRFELCRPGVALYGVNPTPGRPNPMLPVLRLDAPVLQAHEVDAAGTVGYGATYPTRPGSIIATLPVGYADGLPRAVCAGWTARLRGRELPLAGRISMDLMSVDVTALGPEPGLGRERVELIGGPDGVDRLAAAAGTIGYEILTRLGRRFERVYLDEDGIAQT